LTARVLGNAVSVGRVPIGMPGNSTVLIPPDSVTMLSVAEAQQARERAVCILFNR